MTLEDILGGDMSPRRKLAVNTMVLLVCWLAIIGLGTIVAAAIHYFPH